MKIATKLSEPQLDSDSDGHRNRHQLSARNNRHPRTIKTSISSLPGDRDDDDQSPPNSPLRLPQNPFSSNSSISSWSSSSRASESSEDGDACNNTNNNSKEDRMSYSTKFARYHLETYRQNDRMRWNFDFEHNRPLDDQHHHHHQTVARYQWEPAI